MEINQIILIVIVLIAIIIIFIYNRLVVLRNRTKEAWSDIDVQLKRRYNLIPNLIETVKGYAVHEKELFEKVTQARTQAMGAQTVEEHSKAENFLSSTLKSLFAVSENYPQLRASENFSKLQDELTDTENKIQAARRFYNTNVRDHNTAIETFPNNLIVKLFGFQKMKFFELEEGEAKKPVNVKF